MKRLERVLLILCSLFIIDNQHGILSYQIRQPHCHARVARAHGLFQFCTWKHFFLSVNRLIDVYSTQ